MTGNQRKQLGLLLQAVSRSPYLSDIARDAGLAPVTAKTLLAATADLLPAEAAEKEREEAVAPPVLTDTLILNTDGASRGNPGPGGAGAFLSMPDGTMIGAYKKYLGRVTNNEAEYQALLLGLAEAQKAGAQDLEVRMDSELIVRQLTGVYKIKHPEMKKLSDIVRLKEREFKRVRYRHVPREQNTIADRLSNEAIDDEFEK